MALRFGIYHLEGMIVLTPCKHCQRAKTWTFEGKCTVCGGVKDDVPYTVTGYKPTKEARKFVKYPCKGEGAVRKAIADLKLDGGEEIKVFEMKNVTEAFEEVIKQQHADN